MKHFTRLTAIILICLLVSACGFNSPSATPTPTPSSTMSVVVQTPTPSPANAQTTVRINVVGDIMCHSSQLNGAYDAASKSYDFKPWFTDMKPLLSNADLTIANLETTLNGRSDPNYEGYPKFNTPASLLDALTHSGINYLLDANNHALDTGYNGVVNTLFELNSRKIPHTGLYDSQAAYDTPNIITIKGMKIALLNYTYSTNGMESGIPSSKLPYTIRYIDFSHPETMYSDIRKARTAGAEVVMVALHWGAEYQQASAQQKWLAQNLFENGADVILGGHPHCIQGMTQKNITRTDGTTKNCLVAYSLGNFIADQRRIEMKVTETGLMLSFSLTRETTGNIEVKDVSVTPTWIYRWTQNGKYAYRILPLGKYATMAQAPSWMDSTSWSTMKSEWTRVATILPGVNIKTGE